MINTENNTRVSEEELGGDVFQMVEILGREGVAYRHCGEEFEKPNDDFTIKVYPNDSGVRDGRGKKWWMYAECPKCGYGLSLNNPGFFTNLDTDISQLFNG